MKIDAVGFNSLTKLQFLYTISVPTSPDLNYEQCKYFTWY